MGIGISQTTTSLPRKRNPLKNQQPTVTKDSDKSKNILNVHVDYVNSNIWVKADNDKTKRLSLPEPLTVNMSSNSTKHSLYIYSAYTDEKTIIINGKYDESESYLINNNNFSNVYEAYVFSLENILKINGFSIEDYSDIIIHDSSISAVTEQGLPLRSNLINDKEQNTDEYNKIKKAARKEIKTIIKNAHKTFEHMSKSGNLNKNNIALLINSLPFEVINPIHMTSVIELDLSNKSLKQLDDLVCCYIYYHY